MQHKQFQFESEVPWQDLGAGIQRQIYGHDDNIMLVKVTFDKDAVGTLHSHHHSQVTYIEGGKFEVTIGEERKIMNQGDGFYVPPNIIHGVLCLEAGMLVDVFTPQREDFL